jgi:hypothetical protein
MDSLLGTQLERLAGEQACVEISRHSKQPIVGRLIAASPYICVAEKVSDLRVDGVVAVRVQDISRIRSHSRELDLMAALFAGRQAPAMPAVALLELSSAITIFNKLHGSVTVYTEDIESDACFIGEEVALDDEWLHLKEFGTGASRDRADLLISLGIITRVEAGGVYERMLREIYFAKQGLGT